MEYSNGGLRPSAEDIIIYPHQARENMLSYKNNQSQNATKASGDELWVKTDADCKSRKTVIPRQGLVWFA